LGSLILSDNAAGCKGVEDILGQVKSIIKCHKENSNKQGENFNIFSILKMERREVETHSRFIYELLNPKGRHGQGSLFLKEFARIVLKSNSFESARDPKREDVTENLAKDRRIDFTLETDDEVFGIELKIDAADQRNQLSDYLKTLQHRAKISGRKATVFYLTLDGKKASKKSLGVDVPSIDVLGDDDYERVSFSEELLEWIIACIQLSAEKSVLREALIQYKILIEKLTGKNKVLSAMVSEKIRSSIADFEAALCVEKSIDDAKILVQKDLWNKLKKKLKEKSASDKKFPLQFEEYTRDARRSDCKGSSLSENVDEYYNAKPSNRGFGLVCDLGQLNGVAGTHVVIYIEVWRRFYFGLCSAKYDSSGKIKRVQDCDDIRFNAIRSFFGNSNGNEKWLNNVDFLRHNNQDFSFNSFNMVSAKLVDDHVLNEVVDDFVSRIDGLYDEVKKGRFV